MSLRYIGLLLRWGLQDEVKINIEANHATLSGHSFEHEIALAAALGLLGSLDMNRGDTLLGWDTDQFPNDLGETTRVTFTRCFAPEGSGAAG